MPPPPPVSTPPRFGTSAIILDGRGKLLVGQRFGSHGAGSWQLPGGHLERGEGLLGCAAREAREETGLDVEPCRVVATTYDAFAAERKHYVTWFVLCRLRDPGAVPRAMEPAKCPEWHWKTAEELQRHTMFLPLQNLFRQAASLDAVAQREAPVVRLRASRRTIAVRWGASASAGHGLDGDTLTVGPGQDMAVVDAAGPAGAACRLDIVVADPDDADKTVEWPLGDDVLLIPLGRDGGPRASLTAMLNGQADS